MDRSHYFVDRSLYGDEVVARAAHRYTGIYDVEMRVEGDSLMVAFSRKDDAAVAPGLHAQFSRDLLDERLRALVRTETQGLQQELVRTALNQAQPLTRSNVEV
ncbi:hypothetical protein VDR81_14570 [Xanthomonas campestris pv. campestris]|nr:hypothetical protein [Xanthomonas campestris pv. campestris]MEB2038351.1 hypothetical protein [Xanthomonas campestris pv. campestris]MEB2058091.1 hypothetical protein [Xanthomonas campestris pv. campestris]